MQCSNIKCQKLFTPKRKTQKYCCSKCANASLMRGYRKRTGILCADNCGRITNGSSGRCRECFGKHQSHLSMDMTLEEHYNSLVFIKKSPYQKNAQIRLYARYHNPHLVGLPCQKCGYKLHTEFCHKKAIKDFELSAKISEVNAESNLLILCPNCHWELDNGLFDE